MTDIIKYTSLFSCAGIGETFNAGWIENKKPKQLGKKNEPRGARVYIFTSKVWDDENVD